MAKKDAPAPPTVKRQVRESLPTLRPDSPLVFDAVAMASSAKDRRASLVVIAGTPADLGTTLVVNEAATIGREQCELNLSDVRISRQHVTVVKREEEYVLRDNGSTNGTMLNGEKVEGIVPLSDGDKVVLGETVIKFSLVDPTEADYLCAMDRMVGRDDLTGLLAKHRFDAALDEAVRLAHHADLPLCALMMDMDRLKQLNDRHGHHQGAAAIAEVGRIIGRLLKGRGRACRFGGDEFSAFLPGAALPAALLAAEQIRGAVEHARLGPPGIEQPPTITIGVAQLDDDHADAAKLLEQADRALYRAKNNGRNTVST